MIHVPTAADVARFGVSGKSVRPCSSTRGAPSVVLRLAPPPPPPSWLGGLMPGPIVAPAPPGPPVPGYSLWLDATYASNTNATWFDQSGNGYDASITDAGGTFALTSSGINGLASYQGSDGSNSSFAATPTYATGPALTALAVYQLSAAGTMNGRQGLVSAGYATDYILMTSFGRGTGSGTFGYVHASPAGLVGANLDTAAHVASVVYPDPSVVNQASWYQDGALWTTSSATPPAVGSQVRYVGNWEGILNVCINGFIGEIIEYPFALSNAELASVTSYLGAKWGISV